MGFLYIQGAEWKSLVYTSQTKQVTRRSEGILLQVEQGMLQEGMAETFFRWILEADKMQMSCS